MELHFYRSIKRLVILACLLSIGAAYAYSSSKDDMSEIDRYKTDFYYNGIGYQIISESERRVAVTQEYDLDFAPGIDEPAFAHSSSTDDSGSGIIDYTGMTGGIIEIPETVYDKQGTAYTVTDIANGAITHLILGMLVLPPTIESINYGINSLEYLQAIYMPTNLKEIEGISYCRNLGAIQIPWKTETIKEGSLSQCGFRYMYLPPSVKVLEDSVLEECDSLGTVYLNQLQTMGSSCFRRCGFLGSVALPETLVKMGSFCFNDCKDLEVVTLPKQGIEMEDCFNGCPAIKEIIVLAETPHIFPETCFKDVNRSKCKLTVPAGSEVKYKEADGWKEFMQISETPMYLEKSSKYRLSEISAVGHEGFIRVSNPLGLKIDIMDINGNKTASTHTQGRSDIFLSPGVYVVKANNKGFKVAVK